jgi:hypothetical protein
MEVLTKTKSNLIYDRRWLRYRRLYLDGPAIPEPTRPKYASPSSKPTVHTDLGDDADADASFADVADEGELSGSGSYVFDVDDCAWCHQPGNFICGRCNGVPSSALLSGLTTSYCSEECQTLHFYHHQPACSILSQRKALLKVAELLRAIWLKIRAKSYPFNITHIGKEDRRLAIHEGDDSRNMSGLVLFGVPNLGASKPRKRFLREHVLFKGSSRTAVAVLHNIAKDLLQGTSNSP